MTNKYVIDAYAWIEYLAGTERGKKVNEILKSEDDIYTSVLTLAEVTSKVKRSNRDAETSFAAIAAYSNFVEIDCQLARDAGIVHFEGRKKCWILDWPMPSFLPLQGNFKQKF